MIRLALMALVLSMGDLWAQDDGGDAEAEREAQVAALRETISQWVEVEMRRSEERTAWQERKATMGELLEVHRRELALLDEELSQAGASAERYAEAREKLEGEIDALKRVRREIRAAVGPLKVRALALVKRFPGKLAREVEAQRYLLEDWTIDDEPRDAVRALLEIFSAAEQFHRRITRTVEVIDEREVEVIYLGLTRAYYADRRGHAGIGVLAKNGMRWEARPEIADEVVKALDQLDRKRPPELVKFPLKIEKEGEQ